MGRVDIDQRPAVVGEKQRVGDVEMDLVIGRGHSGVLLTINDRATGMLKMAILPSKEAALVQAKAVELLMEWRPLLHTVTTDNAGRPVPQGVRLPSETGRRTDGGLLFCQALPQLGAGRADCAERMKT